MRRVTYSDNWPDNWKLSYQFDLLEVYGDTSHYRGYSYAYQQRRRVTLELVRKAAAPRARVLDIAAAQGNFSLALSELGYDVTWNDLRANLADYTKLKYEQGIIYYAPGNIFDLDFEACFDIVLAAEVIEHVAHPDEFLKCISRMVKPGGHVIVTTPNGEYFLNRLPRFTDCPDPSQYESIQFQPDASGHIFLLHADELENLAERAGLKIVERRFLINTLTNGHLKLENLLKIMPHAWVEAFERFTTTFPLRLRKKLHAGQALLLVRPA